MRQISKNIAALLRLTGKSQSELARFLDVSPQAVAQWVHPDGTSPRGANKVQVAAFFGVSPQDLEYGEFKVDESLALRNFLATQERDMGSQPDPEVREVVAPYRSGRQESVEIQVIDAVGSMGLGRPQPEHESVVDVIRLSKMWVAANLKGISRPENLSALSAYGDSMSPTFADGDILLVDRGVTEIRVDAVYVLSLNTELYIKRVQRRITDGAIIIKSDNKLYDPVVVTNGERENVQVLGRVVWAWNGHRL